MPVRIPNSGEVYAPGERLAARDHWIETLAVLMDGAIPVGRWSIGLDPVLGLLPGIGDLISASISMVIVMRAVQAGIPRVAVARMMMNIAIDTLIGSIPLIGDAFDFAFKANMKNLRIYEQSRFALRTDVARHWGFFITLFVGLAAVVGGVVYGVIAAVRAL